MDLSSGFHCTQNGTVHRSFGTSDPNAIVLGMLPKKCSSREKSKLLQWLSFGVSELRPFHSADCKKDRRKAEHVAGSLSGIEMCLQVLILIVLTKLKVLGPDWDQGPPGLSKISYSL